MELKFIIHEAISHGLRFQHVVDDAELNKWLNASFVPLAIHDRLIGHSSFLVRITTRVNTISQSKAMFTLLNANIL